MDSRKPDLIFAYEGSPYSNTLRDAFLARVEAGGLRLSAKQLPSTRAWASIEWLIPTAFMVYVAKSYFDGFLGEMGRDHYAALKGAVKSLSDRLASVTVTKIGTAGKVAIKQPYSLVFSIWFPRDADSQFKFLFPIDLANEDAEAALECLFTFMEWWHGDGPSSQERAKFADARAWGRTVLIAYAPETKRIELIDPLPPQNRDC